MLLWVVAYVAATTASRVFELVVSARNLRRVRTSESREHGRGHFPLFVVLHVLLPVGLVAEVAFLDAQPPPVWPVLLAAFLAAQILRLWCIRSLGPWWNVRVWITPGMEIVRTGPYRWLRHPNYLAVVIEILAGPLMFGAWRTALIATLVNALALVLRIRSENAALDTIRAAERRT